MIYTCETCNYKTDKRDRYQAHMSTKKHREKYAHTVTETNKYVCNECLTTFAYKSSLNRHTRTRCNPDTNDTPIIHVSTKQNNKLTDIVDIVQHIIKKENNTKTKLEKKIEKLQLEKKYAKKIAREKIDCEKKLAKEKEKETEKERQLTREKDDIRVDHNNYLKGLVVQAGNMVNKSINSVSFLKNNYNTAPVLAVVPDFEKLMDKDEKAPLVDVLIHSFKYKQLEDCVSQMLINHYKKLNPREQSTWNTDPKRNTYIVRSLVNDEPDWVTDKNGERLKALAVMPLVDHIKTLMIKKMDILTKLPESPSKLEKIELVSSLIRTVDSNKFATTVINKMAPHLYLDEEARAVVNPHNVPVLNLENNIAEKLNIKDLDIDEKLLENIMTAIQNTIREAVEPVKLPVILPPIEPIELIKPEEPKVVIDIPVKRVPKKRVAKPIQEAPKIVIDLDKEKMRRHNERKKELLRKNIKIIKTF